MVSSREVKKFPPWTDLEAFALLYFAQVIGWGYWDDIMRSMARIGVLSEGRTKDEISFKLHLFLIRNPAWCGFVGSCGLDGALEHYIPISYEEAMLPYTDLTHRCFSYSFAKAEWDEQRSWPGLKAILPGLPPLLGYCLVGKPREYWTGVPDPIDHFRGCHGGVGGRNYMEEADFDLLLKSRGLKRKPQVVRQQERKTSSFEPRGYQWLQRKIVRLKDGSIRVMEAKPPELKAEPEIKKELKVVPEIKKEAVVVKELTDNEENSDLRLDPSRTLPICRYPLSQKVKIEKKPGCFFLDTSTLNASYLKLDSSSKGAFSVLRLSSTDVDKKIGRLLKRSTRTCKASSGLFLRLK